MSELTDSKFQIECKIEHKKSWKDQRTFFKVYDFWGQVRSRTNWSCGKISVGVIYNSEVTWLDNGIIIVIDHVITLREQWKVVTEKMLQSGFSIKRNIFALSKFPWGAANGTINLERVACPVNWTVNNQVNDPLWMTQ